MYSFWFGGSINLCFYSLTFWFLNLWCWALILLSLPFCNYFVLCCSDFFVQLLTMVLIPTICVSFPFALCAYSSLVSFAMFFNFLYTFWYKVLFPHFFRMLLIVNSLPILYFFPFLNLWTYSTLLCCFSCAFICLCCYFCLSLWCFNLRFL